MKKDKYNQIVAVLGCLTLFLLYKVQVWDPYFFGEKAPVPGVEQMSTEGGKSAEIFGAETPDLEGGEQKSPSVLPESYPNAEQLRIGGELSVVTDDIRARVSLLGGRLTSLSLLGYRSELALDSHPLELISHLDGMAYPLGVYVGEQNDALVSYKLEKVLGSDSLDGGAHRVGSDDLSFVLSGQLPNGDRISKTITFKKSGYFIDVQVAAETATPSIVDLEFTKFLPADSVLNTEHSSGIVTFDGTATTRAQYKAVHSGEQQFSNNRWVGFSDHYFAEVLIAPIANTGVTLERKDETFRLRQRGNAGSIQSTLYLGPKSYTLLKNLPFEVQRIIDLGWASVIAVPLMDLLHLFHYLLGNWGLAIIALTIVVKTAAYPLTAASQRQMKAMQKIAPEIKRLQETITDREEQQRQMIALYKKHGVNPVGGCLPMLPQLPIFVGLYYGLMGSIELRHAHFCFWIKDLSAPEELLVFGLPLPVMVILMVFTMLVVQWTTPTTVTPGQKKVMLIIPLIFGFFFATFPAGMTLYFLVNNLISIGQTRGLRDESNYHPLVITAVVASAIFLFALLCVLVG